LEKHPIALIDSFSTSQIQPIRCLQGSATILELAPLLIDCLPNAALISKAMQATKNQAQKEQLISCRINQTLSLNFPRCLGQRLACGENGPNATI
jgi:hypothetical protein